jgi:hypothetical protein
MRNIHAILIFLLFMILAGVSQRTNVVFAREPQGAAHQDFPPRTGGTPFVVGLPNLTPPTPVPAHPPATHPGTGKPQNPPDAVRVAVNNGYVRALLKGKPYRIKTVAPWPAAPGKIVTMAMYHPATLTGTWLAVGKAPYSATYRRVSSLRVYVNTRRAVVVAIVPHPQIRG